MRIHLLESAQRSIHRFYDSSTDEIDAEVRKQLTSIAMQIASLRRKLGNREDHERENQ
jgi:hypothetical protein